MTTGASSTAAPSRKPRRRWLQFSLRTLLVAMVPVACASAWIGNEIAKGKRQAAAIAWVEGQGGSVEYAQDENGLAWRRRVFGEWYPESVESIDLSLPGLHGLSPPKSGHISFFLDWGKIGRSTTSDITHLSALESLRELILQGTNVTDLSPLAELPNLSVLDVSYTPVSDVSALKGLGTLTWLDLSHTQVRNLGPLAELRSLESLSLRQTPVADLAPLAELQRLEFLEFSGTEITSLTPLADLTSLEIIVIRDSAERIDAQEVQALRKALPHCSIDFR